MQQVIIRPSDDEREQAIEWARETPDGDLLDLDIFEHGSTFLLGARQYPGRTIAYLPVQQPLVLENLIFRPGLNDAERAVAIARLVQYAIAEGYRRDVGEVSFLCRHKETCRFAERHNFVRVDGPDSELKLKHYRMALRETFGV